MDINKMVQESVDRMAKQFPDEDKSKYVKALTTIFETGIPPQQALGFSDEFIEMLYAYAYKLFQSGKFEQASTAYKYLMVLCPFDVRHPMALAATYYKMKKYDFALSNYIVATFLAPQSPMPFYHGADCLMKMDDPARAAYMLGIVLEKAGDNPEYAALKQRAALTLLQLEKQQKQEIKK